MCGPRSGTGKTWLTFTGSGLCDHEVPGYRRGVGCCTRTCLEQEQKARAYPEELWRCSHVLSKLMLEVIFHKALDMQDKSTTEQKRISVLLRWACESLGSSALSFITCLCPQFLPLSQNLSDLCCHTCPGNNLSLAPPGCC